MSAISTFQVWLAGSAIKNINASLGTLLVKQSSRFLQTWQQVAALKSAMAKTLDLLSGNLGMSVHDAYEVAGGLSDAAAPCTVQVLP